MNAVPFPTVDFPDPEIHEAERDFPIVLEPNGRVVNGYLRRRRNSNGGDARRVSQQQQQNDYAYERYDKCIDLRSKGKILYGRIHQRSSSSSNSSSGTVGRYRETEEYVVIKKLSKSYILNQGGMHGATENPRVEISAAQMIGDNVHVVGMYDVLEDKKYLYLIMPYFGTDLFDAVQAASNENDANAMTNDNNDDDNDEAVNNTQPEATILLTTLCRNLLYLQQQSIIHRDFSPENVIVHRLHGEDCCPLIDFAMALQCATLEGQSLSIVPQPTACGKLPYMAPEVVRGDALDFGVDVYALGCTLFFLWTGGKLLYDQPGDRCFDFFVRANGIREAPQVDMDLWFSIQDLPSDWHPILEKLPLVQNLTDAQRDLLANMLYLDPTERLTVPEILQHAYLQQEQP